MQTWSQQLGLYKAAMRRRPAFAHAAAALLKAARGVLKTPIVRRAYSYKQIGKNRTWLDKRALAFGDPARSVFALAMSDYGTSLLMAHELPLLATAFFLTSDTALLNRIRAQLTEMASWSPLQRPGWTAYAGVMPPAGGDGNWLATGTGVRAIADVLEILPASAVGPGLQQRLHSLLASEIDSIVDDWTSRRPWFVKNNNPITNQWVLPTEGLVRACLALGRNRHSKAYELGVRNLLKALGAHDASGAFEEGVSYAHTTVTSLLSAARAMAMAGDRRGIDHPFLSRFPNWMVHHYQPGGFYVNSFDAGGGARGNVGFLSQLIALTAACMDSAPARWALRRLEAGPEVSLPGLLSQLHPAPGGKAVPPPFAAYKRATLAVWRSSWRANATGVWVRGGHALDQHDHADRGHVNFIARGKPILIEAGTPAYHNRRLRSHFQSGMGHNVFQIGLAPGLAGSDRSQAWVQPPGWQKRGSVAPIRVAKLGAAGGDVTVVGTACYDGLRRWHRRVIWSARRVEVRDDVALAQGRSDVILFRWHLGTEVQPSVTGKGTRYRVRWPDAVMVLNASSPVSVSVERMPDHTLEFSLWNDRATDHEHACIVIRSTEPVGTLRLRTEIRSRASRESG